MPLKMHISYISTRMHILKSLFQASLKKKKKNHELALSLGTLLDLYINYNELIIGQLLFYSLLLQCLALNAMNKIKEKSK